MPLGIWLRQLRIGEPNIRKVKLLLDKCAAIERPYGPAPMMTLSTFITLSAPAWKCMLYHVWISLCESKSASRAFCTILDDLSLSEAGREHLYCFRAVRLRKAWTSWTGIPSQNF